MAHYTQSRQKPKRDHCFEMGTSWADAKPFVPIHRRLAPESTGTMVPSTAESALPEPSTSSFKMPLVNESECRCESCFMNSDYNHVDSKVAESESNSEPFPLKSYKDYLSCSVPSPSLSSVDEGNCWSQSRTKNDAFKSSNCNFCSWVNAQKFVRLPTSASRNSFQSTLRAEAKPFVHSAARSSDSQSSSSEREESTNGFDLEKTDCLYNNTESLDQCEIILKSLVNAKEFIPRSLRDIHLTQEFVPRSSSDSQNALDISTPCAEAKSFVPCSSTNSDAQRRESVEGSDIEKSDFANDYTELLPVDNEMILKWLNAKQFIPRFLKDIDRTKESIPRSLKDLDRAKVVESESTYDSYAHEPCKSCVSSPLVNCCKCCSWASAQEFVPRSYSVSKNSLGVLTSWADTEPFIPCSSTRSDAQKVDVSDIEKTYSDDAHSKPTNSADVNTGTSSVESERTSKSWPDAEEFIPQASKDGTASVPCSFTSFDAQICPSAREKMVEDPYSGETSSVGANTEPLPIESEGILESCLDAKMSIPRSLKPNPYPDTSDFDDGHTELCVVASVSSSKSCVEAEEIILQSMKKNTCSHNSISCPENRNEETSSSSMEPEIHKPSLQVSNPSSTIWSRSQDNSTNTIMEFPPGILDMLYDYDREDNAEDSCSCENDSDFQTEDNSLSYLRGQNIDRNSGIVNIDRQLSLTSEQAGNGYDAIEMNSPVDATPKQFFSRRVNDNTIHLTQYNNKKNAFTETDQSGSSHQETDCCTSFSRCSTEMKLPPGILDFLNDSDSTDDSQEDGNYEVHQNLLSHTSNLLPSGHSSTNTSNNDSTDTELVFCEPGILDSLNDSDSVDDSEDESRFCEEIADPEIAQCLLRYLNRQAINRLFEADNIHRPNVLIFEEFGKDDAESVTTDFFSETTPEELIQLFEEASENSSYSPQYTKGELWLLEAQTSESSDQKDNFCTDNPNKFPGTYYDCSKDDDLRLPPGILDFLDDSDSADNSDDGSRYREERGDREIVDSLLRYLHRQENNRLFGIDNIHEPSVLTSAQLDDSSENDFESVAMDLFSEATPEELIILFEEANDNFSYSPQYTQGEFWFLEAETFESSHQKNDLSTGITSCFIQKYYDNSTDADLKLPPGILDFLDDSDSADNSEDVTRCCDENCVCDIEQNWLPYLSSPFPSDFYLPLYQTVPDFENFFN